MLRNEIRYKRKPELINATIASVERNTTIDTISAAGLYSGIISHYFGKQGLIEATLRYLINGFKQALLTHTRNKTLSPEQRLLLIVEGSPSDNKLDYSKLSHAK